MALCWHFKTLKLSAKCAPFVLHCKCVQFTYAEFLSLCRTFPISQRAVSVDQTTTEKMHKSANMFYGCRYLHTSFNKVNNWIRNVQTVWPCPFKQTEIDLEMCFFCSLAKLKYWNCAVHVIRKQFECVHIFGAEIKADDCNRRGRGCCGCRQRRRRR